jgi:hypothetical protein
MIMELGSTHEPIIEVAKAGVLLALEHNMLPKPILQEALRWELRTAARVHPQAVLQTRVQALLSRKRLFSLSSQPSDLFSLVLLLPQAHPD